MKTVLGANGEIGIPDQIRNADDLHVGDSFEIERLMPGHYIITRTASPQQRYTIMTGEDGLPLIRAGDNIITSHRVKEIESLTP